MVIARVFGGLGNQLFIYCAARRLALKNSVPLKLDITSGFKKDYYRRKYGLGHFNIKAEIASRYESYESPAGQGRRYLAKRVSRLLPFEKRRYLTQEFQHFDKRLLELKVGGKVYLEGYWQDERYFKGIESTIREDLKIVTKHDPRNVELAKEIASCNSVSVHARRLHGVPNMNDAKPKDSEPALSIDYYLTAIKKIARQVPDVHFFCFSDFPDWFKENLKIDYPVIFVTHNKADEKNYEDLWLMSLCKHHIIANSTFSWWGAWLSENPGKIVYAPDPKSYKYSPHPLLSSRYTVLG